jgi:hypothetical protein
MFTRENYTDAKSCYRRYRLTGAKNYKKKEATGGLRGYWIVECTCTDREISQITNG